MTRSMSRKGFAIRVPKQPERAIDFGKNKTQDQRRANTHVSLEGGPKISLGRTYSFSRTYTYGPNEEGGQKNTNRVTPQSSDRRRTSRDNDHRVAERKGRPKEIGLVTRERKPRKLDRGEIKDLYPFRSPPCLARENGQREQVSSFSARGDPKYGKRTSPFPCQ